jgi:hypothetical protein
MSITDELRKYAQDWRENPNLMDDLDAGDIDGLLGDFEHIADRIDAEHEKQMAERRRSCVFYDAERNYCKVHDEGDMADFGYARLPVDGEAPSKQLAEWIERRGLVTGPLDANGELWHSGDMSDSNWGVIEGIAFEDGRWFISGHDTSAPWVPADSIRHYHAPTVEDVLREFAYGLGVPVADSYVAATAAKLRLAEGEDA